MLAVTVVIYLDEPRDTSEDQVKHILDHLIDGSQLKEGEYHQLITYESINETTK